MDIEKLILNMIIIILILGVLALAIFNIVTVENKKGFTELYFLGNLPEEVELNKEYYFSFAVHNLENKKMNYTYSIYLKSSKIDEGYIILDHDMSSITNKKFIIENKEENSSIPLSVQLLNKEHEIHFWVNVK